MNRFLRLMIGIAGLLVPLMAEAQQPLQQKSVPDTSYQGTHKGLYVGTYIVPVYQGLGVRIPSGGVINPTADNRAFLQGFTNHLMGLFTLPMNYSPFSLIKSNLETLAQTYKEFNGIVQQGQSGIANILLNNLESKVIEPPQIEFYLHVFEENGVTIYEVPGDDKSKPFMLATYTKGITADLPGFIHEENTPNLEIWYADGRYKFTVQLGIGLGYVGADFNAPMWLNVDIKITFDPATKQFTFKFRDGLTCTADGNSFFRPKIK